MAAMKRLATKIRAMNSMHRLQWFFAMLAIAGCLFSVATIHSHDDGLHALESHCISCDLEDVTSHGAVVTLLQAVAPTSSHIEPLVLKAAVVIAARPAGAPIRAPPFYS